MFNSSVWNTEFVLTKFKPNVYFRLTYWHVELFCKSLKIHSYFGQKTKDLFLTKKCFTVFIIRVPKIAHEVLYYLEYNSFPRNLPFTYFYIFCKPLTVAPKPLTLLWPNSHQTCILGQNVCTRNVFQNVENQSLFWPKTQKSV